MSSHRIKTQVVDTKFVSDDSNCAGKPDGRPSTLYQIKSPLVDAQVLVDTSTQTIYCAIKPIKSMLGWELDKLLNFCISHNWTATAVGDGSAVLNLESQ